MRLPALTVVIGHAASGKSAFAERLVRQSGLAKTYVATSKARDAEMQERIARHRAERAGHGWRTVEAPRALARALAQLEDGEIALVDCVSVWMENLLADGIAWEAEVDILLDVIGDVPAPVVLVTREVGGGLMPETQAGRRYRTAQGRCNQMLAAEADLVIAITAGLPAILKGVATIDLTRHDIEADDLW